jgi:hypothetical protein
MAPHNDAGTSYSPPRSRLRSVSFEIIDDVFVRWVTVTRALDFKKLSDIPYDTALERSAPLPELKKRALDWLKSHENSSSLPIECYLTHCYLPAPEQKHMTLAELGLTGSRQEPLNIFVVPRNLKNRTRDAKTTLNALKRCNRQPEKLDGLSEVLLKVTHFPPFLLALEELQDSEDAILSNSQSNLLAQDVVIDCLVELAIRIMLGLSSKESPRTAAIAHLPNVIDWLLSESLPNAQPIVRPVQLQCMDRTRDPNATDNNHKAFKHVEVVKLPASIGAPPDRDIVEVSLESTNGIQPALLARALYPCYSDTFNYFLEDTPQTRAFLEEDRALPSLSCSMGQERAENQGANKRQPEFTNGKGKMKEVSNSTKRAMPQNQPEETFRSCLALSLVLFTNAQRSPFHRRTEPPPKLSGKNSKAHSTTVATKNYEIYEIRCDSLDERLKNRTWKRVHTE